eukprot:gene15688-6979_t
MGELHHFLGVKIAQEKETGEISISQESYSKDLLKNFQMKESKPVATPVEIGLKLEVEIG